MKVECCMCNIDMGEKPGPEDQISHGLCPGCFQKTLKEIDEYQKTKESKKHTGDLNNE